MKMNIDNEYEKYLNPEIKAGNLRKNDLYHDLPKQLTEMLMELPEEKNKEIIIQNINTYYDSLNTLLSKHIIEHPRMS